MTLPVRCPACGYETTISNDFSGHTLTCPQCQAQFSMGHVQALPSPVAPIPNVLPVMDVYPIDAPPRPLPPHPGFWWAALWCVGILLVTQVLPAILLGIILVVLLARQNLKLEQLQDMQALMHSPAYAQAMLPSLLVSQLLVVGTALLTVRLMLGKEWPRILALRWPTWSHVVLALLALPAMIVIATGIDGLAKSVLPSLIDMEAMVGMFGQWPWPLGVLVIGFGPGIGEELWFRGFFGRGIVARHGVGVGVLLTSLLFGLIHIEPRQVAYASVLGVFLHLSYLASRSLLVPILLHTANNSLSVLSMHSSALQLVELPAEQVPWYVYGSALLLAAAVALAFYNSRAVLTDVPEADADPWRPAFPGVEFPPARVSTRVAHRAPTVVIWLLAFVAFALFVGALAPTAMAANERAALLRERQRQNPVVPSAEAVAELLRKEPITAVTWPAWSARFRSWLGDTSRNTNAAFDEARRFLRGNYRDDTFPAPMHDDAIAWYLLGRSYIYAMADRQEGEGRARLAEHFLRRSIELDPALGRAHYGLAVALFMQLDPDVANERREAEARAVAAEGERLDPTVSAKNAEAWAAMMQERFTDAERLYREEWAAKPDQLKTARAIAQAVTANDQYRGSYADAIEPLRRRFPEDRQLRCLYAVALFRDSRFRDAAKELDGARVKGTDPVDSIGAEWVRRIAGSRDRP